MQPVHVNTNQSDFGKIVNVKLVSATSTSLKGDITHTGSRDNMHYEEKVERALL